VIGIVLNIEESQEVMLGVKWRRRSRLEAGSASLQDVQLRDSLTP
jgi:hypothetical protein